MLIPARPELVRPLLGRARNGSSGVLATPFLPHEGLVANREREFAPASS
jgi:hypothetical protein